MIQNNIDKFKPIINSTFLSSINATKETILQSILELLYDDDND